ncbi:hypothetical protein FQA47_004390 [Oryzias melastigma]|uniref:Uncharacterized protein n=1 Tax=Oryzias melastigma TaxID=30732 RepID=A0A834FMG2_ORYME|nr:hypothetical protein FQA47_004390 [Oryzias melastigma]
MCVTLPPTGATLQESALLRAPRFHLCAVDGPRDSQSCSETLFRPSSFVLQTSCLNNVAAEKPQPLSVRSEDPERS